MADPIYRATVYADEAMSTPLTPAAGAPHSDSLQVATASGVTGFQPYMDFPRGRRGEIQAADRNTDTGVLTFDLLDKKVSSGNLERWVSAFLGDSEGEPQLGGKKVLVEESLDGGSTWNDFFTGRLQAPSLKDRVRIRFAVRDLKQDLKDRIFTGDPHASASNAFPSPLLPVGLQTSYGEVDAISKIPAQAADFVNHTRLEVDEDAIPADLEGRLIVTRALRKAALSPRASAATSGGGSKYELGSLNINLVVGTSVKVQAEITSGARAGETGAFWMIGGYAEGALGTIFGAIQTTPTEEGHEQVQSVGLLELDASDPDHMALPPDGADVEFYLENTGKPTEDHPVFINDTHPVTVLKDVLRGYYGTLDVDGSAITDVSFSDPDNLENDDSFGTFRALIEEPWERWEFIREAILKPYGLGFYFDASGTLVLVDMRPPAGAIIGSLDTLSTSDVDLRGNVDWEHDRSGAITRLDFTAYLDEVKPREEIRENSKKFPDVGPALIETHEVPILVVDIGDPSLGTNPFEINAVGYRASSTEFHNTTAELRNRLLGVADHYRQPFSRGPEFFTLPLRRTATVEGLDLGDFVIVDVDALPDPKTNKRGGSRLAQVISIEPRGPRKVFRLLDYASAQKASKPTLGTPTAAQTEGGGFVVTQPVTVGGGTATVVEYAVTETSVSTRPGPNSSLWRRAGSRATDGDVEFGPIAGQKRVWTRGRDHAPDLLPSAWDFPPAPGYVDTSTVGGISGLTLVTNTGTRAEWNWTPSSTDLRVKVVVTDVTNGVTFEEKTLPAGADGYEVIGTTAGDDYKIEVQQVDELGGKGNVASATWTAGATPEEAPRPAGLELVDPTGKERDDELGQAMWVFPADPSIPLILQVAKDDGSGNPDTGTIREYQIPLGASHYIYRNRRFSFGEVAHYRILHRQDGWNDSEPSAWHSRIMDLLPAAVGPRPPEPQLSADLHVDPSTGSVTLEIDGETGLQSARYYTSKSSFSNALAGSSSTVSLDSQGDATVGGIMTLAHQETAYVVVRVYRRDPPTLVYVASVKVSETAYLEGGAAEDAAGNEPIVTITENEPLRSPRKIAFDLFFDSGGLSPGGGLRFKWKVSNGATARQRTFDHDGDGSDDWFTINSEPVTLNGRLDLKRPDRGLPAMLEVVVEDTAVGSSGAHPTARAYHEIPPKQSSGRPGDDTGGGGDSLPDPRIPGTPPGGGGDGGGGIPIPIPHLPINVRDHLGVELVYDPESKQVGPAMRYPSSGTALKDLEPLESGANVTETRTSADTSSVDGRSSSTVRSEAIAGKSADDDLGGMDSAGYVDRAGQKVTDLEYPSGTKASALEPAEADAQQNPAAIEVKSVSVIDDGTDDDYSATWNYSSRVDSTYDVTMKCYREGVFVGSTTVSATSGSANLTDGGAGDSSSDDHSITLELKNSGGDILQTQSVNDFPSTI